MFAWNIPGLLTSQAAALPPPTGRGIRSGVLSILGIPIYSSYRLQGTKITWNILGLLTDQAAALPPPTGRGVPSGGLSIREISIYMGYQLPGTKL